MYFIIYFRLPYGCINACGKRTEVGYVKSYVRDLDMILSLICNIKRGCLVLLKFAKMTQKPSFNNVFTFIKKAMLAKSKNVVFTTW